MAQGPIACKSAPLSRFGQCDRCGEERSSRSARLARRHAQRPWRCKRSFVQRIASGFLPHKRQPGEIVDLHSREQSVGEQGTPAHRTLNQTNASRAQSLPPYAGRNFPSAEHTARHTPLNPHSTCAVRQRRRPTSLRSHPSAGQKVRIMGRCVEGVHRTQSTPPKQCLEGCVDEIWKRPPIRWTRGSASRRSRFLQPARVAGRPVTFHAGRSGHGKRTSHDARCSEGTNCRLCSGRSVPARGCTRRLRRA